MKEKFKDVCEGAEYIINGKDIPENNDDNNIENIIKKMNMTSCPYEPVTVEEEKTIIQKLFMYFKKCELEFSTLELVYYAILSKNYYNIRKRDAHMLEIIRDYINISNDKLVEKNEEKRYLNCINMFFFESIIFVKSSICEGNCTDDGENKYLRRCRELLEEAKQNVPDGQIIELLNEIFEIEHFFNDPTQENIERLNRTCFMKKNNWMDHIMCCEQVEASQVDTWEYEDCLPHIELIHASERELSLKRKIESSKPYRDGWRINYESEEDHRYREEVYQSDLATWEDKAYKQIFMQPYPIHTKETSGQLMYTLLKTLTEKQNQSKKKAEMMDYYAHSWKHISYPQIVKEIAEELGQTNRVLSNRLMKAYNSEKTLQRSIQLLQYISSDDDNRVSEEFRNGVARSGKDTNTVVDLEQVINESIDLVVFKLLMTESDDSKVIEKCRVKWEKEKSLDGLREEYTSKFLMSDNKLVDVRKWVSNNLIEIELEINNDWKNVRFKEESFTVNQFKEILVEVFTNVLLHGKDKMKLCFDSDEEIMIITEKNKCYDAFEGSKSGISTMKKVIQYINGDTKIDSVITKNDGKNFEISIRFDKRLLIRKGR